MEKQLTKFKITRIESGVFAREVNPYGEKPSINGDFENQWEYSEQLRKWQQAESPLQEYPLTEESGKMLLGKKSCEVFDMIIENGLTPQNFVEKLYDKMINQEITGEIVIENGVKKIKI